MLPVPGELVGGKYRVVRLLGEGGMGSVFEAVHEHLGSRVALKFLHPELSERRALVARFLQEGRVSASIRSPHVTHVVDVDQTPAGLPYLVMELLEGESLEQRLARDGKLSTADAVDIALQILAALTVAHAGGVVHRDLKPDNVWLVPLPTGPHVKLLDFGIAKLKAAPEYQQVKTRPGSMMGTPAYMAPEQAISADQVDARADLYSFGVIFFQMLSGARPLEVDDAREILERLVRGDVPKLCSISPGTPPGLGALVDRLLSLSPDDRPASAEAVRAEVVRYARASSPALATPTGVADTLPPDDSAPPHVGHFPATTAPLLRATDSMPEARAPGPPPGKDPRRTQAVLLVLFIVLGAVGISIGVVVLTRPAAPDPLPPMPGAAPVATAAVRDLDAGVRRRRARVPRGATPPRTSPQAAPPAAPTGTLALSATSAPSSAPPLPMWPGLSPSSIAPFASGLPPFLQQIPGLVAPVAAPVTAPVAAPSGGAPVTAP